MRRIALLVLLAALPSIALNRRDRARRDTPAFQLFPGGPAAATAPKTNLLLRSQEFDDAAWIKQLFNTSPAISIASDTIVAPDGTTTADAISFPVNSASNHVAYIYQSLSLSPSPYTASIWLKAASGTPTIYLFMIGGGVWDDTLACSLTTSWQRFELPNRYLAGTYYYALGFDRQDADQGNTPAQVVHAWGAMLQANTSASSYILTTSAAASVPVAQGAFGATITNVRASVATSIDSSGLVTTQASNVGRVEPQGLLVELARTNLALRSAEFDNAAWTKNATGAGAAPTIPATNILAPDGSSTAESISFPAISGASDGSFMSQPIVATAVAYSLSVWLKVPTGTATVWLSTTPDGVTYHRTQCNVTTNWRRCKLENKTLTVATWYFFLGCDRRDASQTGMSAATVYTWAASFEAGFYASSDILTTSVAVTRAADIFSIANPLASSDVNWSINVLAIPYGGGSWLSAATRTLVSIGPTTNVLNSANLGVLLSGKLSLSVLDGAGLGHVDQSAAAIPDGPHWFRFSDQNGTTNAYADEARATAPTYLGTAIIAIMPSTIYIGSDSTSRWLGGYISDLTIRRGAGQ